jgi:hypothetical protein
MIILFVLGTYLFLDKLNKLLELGRERSILLFISLFLVFFSLLQAADLYQVLYWRAAMATHMAPVVLLPFLGTFLLSQAGSAGKQVSTFWAGVFCFVFFFLLGGFSEPPAAMMITALALTILSVGNWGNERSRRIITILLWSLAGASMALLLMALSPSLSAFPRKIQPDLWEFVSFAVRFPVDFLMDTLRTMPLSTLVTILVPALLVFLNLAGTRNAAPALPGRRLGIMMLAVLLLAYVLIAASFAPSAYAGSYPMGRVRFSARWILTLTLLIEGGLIGMYAARLRTGFTESAGFRSLAALSLVLLALYPLRTVWRLVVEVPVYQQRAAAWDLRDAEIRSKKAQGMQDIVVGFLPEVPTQDLGDRAGFRLNRCAAIIYGVNSILAVPMDGE